MFDGCFCRARRALRLGEEHSRLFGHREERRPVLPLEGETLLLLSVNTHFPLRVISGCLLQPSGDCSWSGGGRGLRGGPHGGAGEVPFVSLSGGEPGPGLEAICASTDWWVRMELRSLWVGLIPFLKWLFKKEHLGHFPPTWTLKGEIHRNIPFQFQLIGALLCWILQLLSPSCHL